MDGETLQQKTIHKGRENRQDGCGDCVLDNSKQIKGTTEHNEAKAKGYQRHCFNMCGVAQNAEDIPGHPPQQMM